MGRGGGAVLPALAVAFPAPALPLSSPCPQLTAQTQSFSECSGQVSPRTPRQRVQSGPENDEVTKCHHGHLPGRSAGGVAESSAPGPQH